MITCPGLTAVLLGLVTGLAVIAKLLLDTAIKEGVKAQFDRQLESHKAALDLQKQQALKDFGLFADKKHQVNTAVYSAIRSAYRSVNKLVLGWLQVVKTEVFTATELDEFLSSLGANNLPKT